MRAAVISDTHGLLRPEVAELLSGADAILHAGDINTQKIVDELRSFAPLYIVRGNNDKEWAGAIPPTARFSLGSAEVFMVHNKKDVPAELGSVDLVVYGHSHRYSLSERGGAIWLNPGNCGPRRFGQEISMAMAEISGGVIRIEKIVIPNPAR